jgi:hypothetical protein
MKKIKQIIIIGLITGLIIFILMRILTLIEGIIFPEIHKEYENFAIFRRYEDPLTLYFFIHPFVLGMILSLVWQKVKILFKDINMLKKGARYGVYFWLTAMLPGLLLSISIYQISILMTISTMISTFIHLIFAGIVLIFLDNKIVGGK